MGEAPTFRGYWSIKEVLERMDPLVEWTKKFKPAQRHLTLAKKDYDLIRRWPKAAHVHQIEVVNGEVYYHGFELTFDSGPGRYEKADAETQIDVEDLIMKKDGRDAILVRNDRQGFVDGNMTVETISGSALAGVGLYVMVPVANERDADELLKQLRAA